MELKSMDRLRMFEIVLFFLERIYNVSSFRKIVINWKILKDVSLIPATINKHAKKFKFIRDSAAVKSRFR